ncbi:MAG: hypothetical protein AAB393_13750 [Bacteroidota bacterium]
MGDSKSGYVSNVRWDAELRQKLTRGKDIVAKAREHVDAIMEKTKAILEEAGFTLDVAVVENTTQWTCKGRTVACQTADRMFLVWGYYPQGQFQQNVSTDEMTFQHTRGEPTMHVEIDGKKRHVATMADFEELMGPIIVETFGGLLRDSDR